MRVSNRFDIFAGVLGELTRQRSSLGILAPGLDPKEQHEHAQEGRGGSDQQCNFVICHRAPVWRTDVVV
jgi:hypothetical protein